MLYSLSCHLCVFCQFSFVFFFKHKTAYDMRISDWSSDVCSSDLRERSALSRGSLGAFGCQALRSKPPNDPATYPVSPGRDQRPEAETARREDPSSEPRRVPRADARVAARITATRSKAAPTGHLFG